MMEVLVMPEVKYEILYPGPFAMIKMNLEHGQKVKAEYDAMVAMGQNLDVDGNMEGGFMAGIGRMLAGEKFFFQTVEAKRGPGEVLFSPSFPGDVMDVDLDGSYTLVVQKDGFLAATNNITISTKMQNLMQGVLSGEGFFVLKLSGKGTAFINAYGSMHAMNLEKGEKVIIDNQHLVAWPEYMDYKIKKASSGWISSMTSGEALVTEFTGPGVVIIQTRNPNGFGRWINKWLPKGKG
jgi:uncharacterized protein (TIGR00266 family)